MNVNWCIRDWGCGVLYESITSFRFFIIKGQLFASQKRRICKTLDLQRAWILKSRITFLASYETDIIDSIAKAVFLLFLPLYRNSQKIEGRSEISNGCSILKSGTHNSWRPISHIQLYIHIPSPLSNSLFKCFLEPFLGGTWSRQNM